MSRRDTEGGAGGTANGRAAGAADGSNRESGSATGGIRPVGWRQCDQGYGGNAKRKFPADGRAGANFGRQFCGAGGGRGGAERGDYATEAGSAARGDERDEGAVGNGGAGDRSGILVIAAAGSVF